MSFMCMLSSLGTDGSTARTKGGMGGGGGGGGGPSFFFVSYSVTEYGCWSSEK